MNGLRLTTRRLAMVALLAGAVSAGVSVHADDDDDHVRARRALEKGEVLPLRSVLDQVEREVPGQVLKIEFEYDDGRFIYEIRMLQPDGRVAKLKVDASDGRVLRIKRKKEAD